MARAVTLIPCILTFSRIALIPALLYLITQGAYLKAFAVFIAICLTDIFDGITARALNACTRFGGYMDAFADLLYAMASLIVLNVMELAPVWFTAAAALKFLEFALTSAILKKNRHNENTWIFDGPGRFSAALIFITPGVFCLAALIPDSGLYVVYSLLMPACVLAAASSALRIVRCVRSINEFRRANDSFENK